MKSITIWQRLNTAFWLLIVLLLAGVGLALWAANARSVADRRSEQLAAARGNIAYKVVLISDTVRGLLLDPKNEMEKRLMREAEDRTGVRTAVHPNRLCRLPRPDALGNEPECFYLAHAR